MLVPFREKDKMQCKYNEPRGANKNQDEVMGKRARTERCSVL